MPKFHQQTKHSYTSVRKNAFFLDWQTQPRNHKLYPHFYPRYKIETYESLKDLNLIGGITFEKAYPEGKYYLRTVPSAGALFPFELYLQLRGVEGLPSGIYHYEPHQASLVLLHEIDSDGVESCFNPQNKVNGILFLISSVYFRSLWKYRDRSIRYILLDAGHQLGAIYATLCVMGKVSELVFDFDKLTLNETFGFRNDEMFLVTLKSSETTEKATNPLKQKLPFVSGCDYLETNTFIEEAYKESVNYTDTPFTPPDFFTGISRERLKHTILQRRSIRAFRGSLIEKEQFEFIVNGLFDFAHEHQIDIYYTLHRVKGMTEGLYQGDTLIKAGNFQSTSRYLSLEQNLGGMSAATFYFTSNEVEKYQKVNILSGFIAHIIYLRCEIQRMGCSGIGAYYDDEAKAFLGTGNNILYLLAIGR